MRTMLAAAFACLCLQSSAQKPTISIQVAARENYLTSYFQKEYKVEYSRPGGHVAGLANFPLSGKFDLQPGLAVALKGGSFYQSPVNILAVEVPVSLIFKHNGFFIGAGPGLSYGIYGRTDESFVQEQDVFDEDCELAMKRLDIQVNATMGYNLSNHYSIGVLYMKGLRNISALKSEYTYTNKLSSYGLTLTYHF